MDKENRVQMGSVSLQWPPADLWPAASCSYIACLNLQEQLVKFFHLVLPKLEALIPPDMFKRSIFNLDFAKSKFSDIWQNADSETLPQPDATGQSTKGGGGRTFTGAAWAMGILGILGLRFLKPSLQGFRTSEL